MTKPTKLYYSITEVADMTELKPHILRYWETEFPVLHPKKNRAGNRAYRAKDIETVKLIRKLLYDDGFTIDGAKKQLKKLRSQGLKVGEDSSMESEEAVFETKTKKVEAKKKAKKLSRETESILLEIRDGLKEILNLLSPPKAVKSKR